MDEELTLRELRRLEAERMLRGIPKVILDTVWVRDAQIEAVIDAVLAVTVGGDVRAIARARNGGEWCARIASALSYAPGPGLARRVGVLRDVDPAALARIAELEHLSSYVSDYQAYALGAAPDPRTLSLIVAVADEFDARIAPDDEGRCTSPASALRAMLANATESTRPIVEALRVAANPSKSARVA